MSGLWDEPSIARRGWVCVDVYDAKDGDDHADIALPTCEMCCVREIRYVHVMEHPDHPGQLEVGCICAGWMTGDLDAARRREAVLVNRAARRRKWTARRWRTSRGGNLWLRVDGTTVGVFRDPFHPGAWKTRVGDRFGRRRYPDAATAQLALFDELDPPMVRPTMNDIATQEFLSSTP